MASLVLFKWELDDPSHRTRQRHWQRAEAGLVGTQLRLSISGNDFALSMQGADVGIATDYCRRSFVLRVRAEGRQFLIATGAQLAMVEWLLKLNESIAISLSLDTRVEPPQYTLPKARGPQVLANLSDELWRRWREQRWKRTEDLGWLDQEKATKLPKRGARSARTLEGTSKPDATDASQADRKATLISHTMNEQKSQSDEAMVDDGALAQKCARVLWYDSIWRDKSYFRQGSTVANPRWEHPLAPTRQHQVVGRAALTEPMAYAYVLP